MWNLSIAVNPAAVSEDFLQKILCTVHIMVKTDKCQEITIFSRRNKIVYD